MNKPIVRCRCGHQVLGKEVLRTDFYERSSGREMVYIKFRCRRCKRMGEAFVAEADWDWSIFEAPRNEMSEGERDRFLDEKVISSGDVLSFHRELKRAQNLAELIAATEASRLRSKGELSKNRKSNGETQPEVKRRPGS